MSNLMRMRIAGHLATMGLKPSSQRIKDALTEQGLHKTYLYEFMSGKKDTVALKSLPLLAKALNVAVGFLDGSEGNAPLPQIKIGGICEQGAWRAPSAPRDALDTFFPDARVDTSNQLVFHVRGDHAARLGIVDDSWAVVGLGMIPRTTDIVLIERSRDDGMQELRLQKHDANSAAFAGGDQKIIGIVLSSIKKF